MAQILTTPPSRSTGCSCHAEASAGCEVAGSKNAQHACCTSDPPLFCALALGDGGTCVRMPTASPIMGTPKLVEGSNTFVGLTAKLTAATGTEGEEPHAPD